MVLMTKLSPILRRNGSLTLSRNETNCQWREWFYQHLSRKTLSPVDYSQILSATTATKRVTWSKAARNSNGKIRRTPKKADQFKRNATLSGGLVERKTTLRNDVGKLQVRISNLNVLCPKTHRIAIQNAKHRKLPVTQHRPLSSPHQRRAVQRTNFATALTLPSSISPTICQI